LNLFESKKFERFFHLLHLFLQKTGNALAPEVKKEGTQVVPAANPPRRTGAGVQKALEIMDSRLRRKDRKAFSKGRQERASKKME